MHWLRSPRQRRARARSLRPLQEDALERIRAGLEDLQEKRIKLSQRPAHHRGERQLVRESWAVTAPRAQRIVTIGERGNSSSQGDSAPSQPVRITGAVK